MKKQEVTDLLLKEGWIPCKMPNATVAWLLYHPTKFICYRTSPHVGSQKSFFITTKNGRAWLQQGSNRNQVNAQNPAVSRYIGVGAWGRCTVHPATKLIIDEDEFLAFNYGV